MKSIKRVLVVEDEVMVAMGLEIALTDAGYEVVGPIGWFDQAMEAAIGQDVDFALLDVNLRGEPVFPVADVLTDRHVPFAFLTGYGRESLPPSQAMANVLSKPFKPKDLLAAVDSMLG